MKHLKQLLAVTVLSLSLVNGVAPIQGAPSRTSTQVHVLYPDDKATMAKSSIVLFGWDTFPGASQYVLHVWAVKMSEPPTTTGALRLGFTIVVAKNTTFRWGNTGYRKGSYRYNLIPYDANGNALADWSTVRQFTLS